jgi:type VI secretion system secreted protein VgrG
VTPTPTRPAGVVPPGGGEQESFQRPNLEEPYEPPAVIEETETPPTPTLPATATPVTSETPAPTEAVTPVETPTQEPAATTPAATASPTTT